MFQYYYNSSFLNINEQIIPSIKGNNQVGYNVLETVIFNDESYENEAGVVQFNGNIFYKDQVSYPTFENIQLFIDKCNWIYGMSAHLIERVYPSGTKIRFNIINATGRFKHKKYIEIYVSENGKRTLSVY